jgi:hypothetical protein
MSPSVLSSVHIQRKYPSNIRVAQNSANRYWLHTVALGIISVL